MELKYSTPVSEGIVRKSGCFTTLPVRYHQDEELAIRESKRMEADWKKAFGVPPFSQGCQNPAGHLASLSLPECLPGRIGICAYIMDYMLHHDDIADLDKSKAKEEHAALSTVIQPDVPYCSIPTSTATRKEAFQKKMLAEIFRIDGVAAVPLLAEWQTYATFSADGVGKEFRSFDEYLTHRRREAGIPLFLAIACYAMKMSPNEEDLKAIAPIMEPISLSMALVNDYFSWDKEYQSYVQNGCKDQLYSSVKILMDENSLSPEEAKEMVKEKIVAYEKEYTKLKEDWLSGGDRPWELRKYLETTGLMASGSCYWHSGAPRYNDVTSNGAGPSVTSLKEFDGEAQDNIETEGQISDTSPDDMFSTSQRSSVTSSSDGVSEPLAETVNGILNDRHPNNPSNKSGLKRPSDATGPPSKRRQTQSKDCNGEEKRESLFSSPHGEMHFVLAPFEYLMSMPSKGIRRKLIETLNVWLNVPESKVDVINEVIDILHNASLMLDDIQDRSPLRRARPAAHTIYGTSQTTNTATFLIVLGLKHVQNFLKPECHSVYTDMLLNLHIGQSWDIEWTDSIHCPKKDEYFEMIDKSQTGSLFHLLANFMRAESKETMADFAKLMRLIGRFFQIRDDYQNLMSRDYTDQKGFCEDLDEGKFSLPLLLTMESAPTNNHLWKILHMRRQKGGLSHEIKLLMLEHMKEAKGLERTAEALRQLQDQIEDEIQYLEQTIGVKNPEMRQLVAGLKV